MDSKLSFDTTWSDQLTPETIDLRKRWLSFSNDDEELVREVDEIIEANIDPMIDDMYAHFLGFEQTRAFFPDAETLKRAQDAQKRYFLRMTKGVYDSNYVAQRLAVGETHYRIGLDPTWYLGAYNRVLTWLRRMCWEKYADDSEKYLKLISAITRLVFFDMGLAIEAYSRAKENAIRRQRDAIIELETERRVTTSILEDAPIGIMRLDRDLICIETNAELAEILARDRESIAGKHLSEIAPKLNLEPFYSLLTSGHPLRKSAEALDLSCDEKSTPTYFDWAVWPVKDVAGHTSGLVATFTDATNRVLLQQQREDFVATLTHDLKTPILAANRAIKLLMAGDFGAVAESQHKILETIHHSNEALYKLVQTLLDVYRYDSGAKQLTFAECSINDMINSQLAELQPLASSKNITIDSSLPESPLNARCDAAEVRRVIQNLLDNALKFTPSGGSITVSLDQRGTVTHICVADTGKGISEEDQPKLFQRFWAAASSGRYYASTGLGLYLCRKIVESHGGRIWCESSPGKGSRFHFTLEPLRVIAQPGQEEA